MAERSVRDSDFDHDERGSLVYWDSILRRYSMIEPGSVILDPSVVVGKIGQQNILPTHFSLKPKDFELTQIQDEEGNFVGDPILPGVSMFLFFGSNQCKQDSLANITREHLGRKIHPKNRLYIAQVGDIEKWSVFYAPLINRNYPIYNPLHVIVVPNSMTFDSYSDATELEKRSIADVFVRWDC